MSGEPRDIGALEPLLAHHREAMLEEVARFDDDALARAPAEGRWSAAEILEHLALIEQLVATILHALANGRALPAPAAVPSRRLPTTWTMDRRFRVEAPQRVRPRGGLTRAQLLANLAASRARLLEVMAALRDRDVTGLRYTHPFLGDYDAFDWIEYVAYHDDRHRQQMVENRSGSAP